MPIAQEDIFINCPFHEKDQAKSYGARWNGQAKSWFIPKGTEITPFEPWLEQSLQNLNKDNLIKETSADEDLENNFGRAPDNAPQMSIRDFIYGVKDAILKRYDHDVWLVGQITSIRERKSMVLIELMDSEQEGAVSAARIEVKSFGQAYKNILQRFIGATGQKLEAGLTVRMKIRPEFDPKFHLGARLIEIDPSATLGAFELKLRQIKQKLIEENIFDLNKKYTTPSDYFKIAVIHPYAASGFEDFKQDANILEKLNLCKVHYISATFEGANCEKSLLDAFSEAKKIHQKEHIDALIVIRGGGSKQGLMAVATESLARAICLFPAPVITGIGHADDTTLLDEVAWKRCDTPSKTIAYIRDIIRSRAQEGLQAFQKIQKIAENFFSQTQNDLKRYQEKILSTSLYQLQNQTHLNDLLYQKIITKTPEVIKDQNTQIDTYLKSIQSKSDLQISKAISELDYQKQSISKTSKILEQQQEKIDDLMHKIKINAKRHLDDASDKITRTQNLIKALGPDETLKRGFALALDKNGKPLTTTAQIQKAKNISLKLKDGNINLKTIEKET